MEQKHFKLLIDLAIKKGKLNIIEYQRYSLVKLLTDENRTVNLERLKYIDDSMKKQFFHNV